MKPSWSRCLTRAVVCVTTLSMLAITARADHNPAHTEAQMNALQIDKSSTAGQDDDCPDAEKIRERYANIPLGDGCAVGPRRMSLLGVQSDMGPDVRGTVRALSDAHPLRIKLWCKAKELEKVYDKETADLKQMPGEKEPSPFKREWAKVVEVAQRLSAQYERELAAATRALSEKRTNAAAKEDVERLSAQVAEVKARLTEEKQTLAWAQRGLAEHEARLTQAKAAHKAAYEAALTEAQKCK